MNTVHVLCGLPGSGKTTFSLTLKNVFVVNVDEMMLKNENVEEKLKELETSNKSRIYVLDGLFLTNVDYKKVLNIFRSEKVLFHFWEEDREACLHNDLGRREKNSHVTIKHAAFEMPNVKELSKINENISLITHKITRK